MNTPDIAGLCERLRAGESSRHGGVTTNWYRNPDGIEAADTLERQAAEIERLNATCYLDSFMASERKVERQAAENKRLREAAQAVIDRWEAPLWKDVPATAVFIANLKAALTGEDTAGSPTSQNTEPGLAFSGGGEP